MFLSALNKEGKELFLELAFNIAMIDGVYSDEEKVLMGCYCQEMQITFNKENMTKSTDEIIKEINNKCDSRSKKIMIFEAIGLGMVDGDFDGDERAIILKMLEEFNIDVKYASECENAIKEYLEFQTKLNKIVIE